MTVAGLQAQLLAEVGGISPPYNAADIRDRIARAIHAGVGTVVTLSATHGTMAALSSPGGTPRGFTPLEAFDGSGNPMRIANWRVHRTGGGSGPVVGVTIEYDLRHTEPLMHRRATANLSIPNAAAAPYTSVLFDQGLVSVGSAISYSAGVFTVSEPGRYLVHFDYRWEVGTTNWLDQEVWLATGAGVQINYGHMYEGQSVAIAKEVVDHLVAMPVFTASDISLGINTFELKAYQRNASSLSKLLYGTAGGAIYSNVMVQRLHNDSTPTGTVRGILWDG